jgi:long-chain acyl-CoA synthetase
MNTPKRLFDFAYYQLENFPLEKMMTSKVEEVHKTYSTKEYIDAVNSCSRGLLKLGVSPGDKIGLISHNNRCEWNIMDAAILQLGAINVPIYPTMTEGDYEYILNHAELSYCFVSNADLFHKVSRIKDKVPSLISIYTFEPVADAPRWTDIHEASDDTLQQAVDKLKDGVKEDDLATIIYTSGTTGLPKGVMLSHKNVSSNTIASTFRLPAMEKGTTRVLSFLPVCHIYERMIHYMYMYNGAHIFFAESLETIKEDLAFSKPHMFTAVPRLLEKFYDGIVDKGSAAGGVKGMIFNWALNVALAWEPDGQNGSFYEWKLALARKLVFSKVKEALSLTNIMAVASGSAALQSRLARFFNGAGIPVLEGYGLTETSPVCTVNADNSSGLLKIGTVGKAITDVEIAFAADGEIKIKGPNVMLGYYKDPEKTDEVLKEGWFYTGDIGELDSEGFLKITDRKKELFKTSGGKYVAPQLLENAMKASRFIDQIMVVGENRKFPAALIVPNVEVLREWCRRHEVEVTLKEDIIANKQVQDRVWRDVEKLNTEFAQWEKIKKISLLEKDFSIEGGDLTPTMKLKRKPILHKYSSLIEELYA